MGDEQRGRVDAGRKRRELGPQPRRDRLIERHERLVEQEKIRTDRKGPGDRRPSCKPERQFSRVSGEIRAETKYVDELPEIDFHLIGGKREANVFLDGAPGQQARFLKDDSEAPGSWGAY